MNLCAIYLDGSQSIQNDSQSKDLDNRQNFLMKALEDPVGSSQFLVTTHLKPTLEMLGILPSESRIIAA